MKPVHTRHLYADIYITLAAAMLLGRVAGGIASMFFNMGNGKAFTIAIWAATYFTGVYPCIISQLVVIPILVFTLMRAKIIPARYSKIEK